MSAVQAPNQPLSPLELAIELAKATTELQEHVIHNTPIPQELDERIDRLLEMAREIQEQYVPVKAFHER